MQREMLVAVTDKYELFFLDLSTGLRRGEIVALQWDDLDFDTGVLTVNKQVYKVNGKLQLSVPKTKASIRKLILPPSVMEVLWQYRERKVLLQQLNAERQALRDQVRGITPPDKLTKTQKRIWMYMKFHPDVTSYRIIGRGTGVTKQPRKHTDNAGFRRPAAVLAEVLDEREGLPVDEGGVRYWETPSPPPRACSAASSA